MAEGLRRATIARLNDSFRFTGENGWTYLSRGVAALPILSKEEIIRAVRFFADFSASNDPHGEHDCAAITVGGQEVIWKIDYHASGLGAADPANPATTRRVMTIMLAEEY